MNSSSVDERFYCVAMRTDDYFGAKSVSIGLYMYLQHQLDVTGELSES
jgi:hypothetical protein